MVLIFFLRKKNQFHKFLLLLLPVVDNLCVFLQLFHLQDVRCEKPQFLSKSFLGFVIFNIISFFFLLIELLTTSKIAPNAEERVRSKYFIFNQGY